MSKPNTRVVTSTHGATVSAITRREPIKIEQPVIRCTPNALVINNIRIKDRHFVIDDTEERGTFAALKYSINNGEIITKNYNAVADTMAEAMAQIYDQMAIMFGVEDEWLYYDPTIGAPKYAAGYNLWNDLTPRLGGVNSDGTVSNDCQTLDFVGTTYCPVAGVQYKIVSSEPHERTYQIYNDGNPNGLWITLILNQFPNFGDGEVRPINEVMPINPATGQPYTNYEFNNIVFEYSTCARYKLETLNFDPLLQSITSPVLDPVWPQAEFFIQRTNSAVDIYDFTVSVGLTEGISVNTTKSNLSRGGLRFHQYIDSAGYEQTVIDTVMKSEDGFRLKVYALQSRNPNPEPITVQLFSETSNYTLTDWYPNAEGGLGEWTITLTPPVVLNRRAEKHLDYIITLTEDDNTAENYVSSTYAKLEVDGVDYGTHSLAEFNRFTCGELGFVGYADYLSSSDAMYFRLVLVYDPVPGRCHDVVLTIVDGDAPIAPNINILPFETWMTSLTDASFTTTVNSAMGEVSACVVNTPCNTKPAAPFYSFSVAQTNGEPLPTIDARCYNSYILEVDGVRYTPIDISGDPTYETAAGVWAYELPETAAGVWAYELPESTVLVALATLNDELMIQLMHVESREANLTITEQPFRFTLIPDAVAPVNTSMIPFVITDMPLEVRAKLSNYHTWVFDDGSVTSCYKPIAGAIHGG